MPTVVKIASFLRVFKSRRSKFFGPQPGLKVRRVAPGRRPGTLWSAGSLPGLSVSGLELQRVSTLMILQPFYRLMIA